jgi:hypothetical protein
MNGLVSIGTNCLCDASTVAFEEAIRFGAAIATGWRHEGIHDVFILYKVLANLD